MKIPTIVHEQNAFPGVTIKILARFVDVVAISFVESKKYLNVKKKLIHTGNPIKQDILTKKRDDSRAEIGVDSRPFILAFGGSLGAERINEALIAYIRSTVNDNRVQLLFSTGEREYQNVSKKLKNSGIDLQSHRSIKIVPYIYKMDTAISGADLIISRAGAITLAEITAKGVPAILIPSPNVTNNHQEYNARVLERAKAAVVLLERDLSARTLKETIEKLLGDKDLLKDMASNSYKIGIRDATEKIYGEITALLK
jgi:UDP-N-acetylglucosamine--N-acetylmuramyl-(pentapeptide) pyrophosphoryl-undecaprenol N-acetylglucosamine transferase